MVRAMIAAATAPDIDQQVINIGGGRETSIREAAELARDLTGERAELIYAPRNDAGVSRMCADLTQARKLLGYAPRYGLEEGLQKTLDRDSRFKAAGEASHA